MNKERYLELFREQKHPGREKADPDTVYYRVHLNQGVLELSCFCTGQERPDYRIFFNEKEQWMTYDTVREDWTQRNINELSYFPSRFILAVDRVLYQYRDKEERISKRGRVLLKRFLKVRSRDNVYRMVLAWQVKKKLELKTKRFQKEADEIDEDMRLFTRPIPKGFLTFEKDVMFAKNHRMFFNRKEKWAYCTKCGTRHEISALPETPKQSKRIKCPACRSEVTGSARIPQSLKNREFVEWGLVTEVNGDKILLRYIRSIMTINGCEPASYQRAELQRDIIEPGQKPRGFMMDQFHRGEYRWCMYRDHNGFFNPSMYQRPVKGIWMYSRGMEKVRNVTGYEYSAFDVYGKQQYTEDAYWPYFYLIQYPRSPWCEHLVKDGLFKLVNNWIRHEGNRVYYEVVFNPKNKYGNSTKEILGLDTKGYRRLRMMGDVTAQQLSLLTAYNYITDEADFRKMLSNPFAYTRKDKILALTKNGIVTPHKFLRYVDRMDVETDLYLDYLDLLQEAHYPLHRQYLFPRDFKTMHDLMTLVVTELREEQKKREQQKKQEERIEKEKLWQEKVKKLLENPAFHIPDSDYCIVIPMTYADFQKESEILHHCVRTYFDKVMNGDTMIFFIRKVSDMETPFFTLEIDKDLRLIQCRTKYNKSAAQFDGETNEHVMKFANSFRDQFVNAA